MDREKLDRWLEWGMLALLVALVALGPVALGLVRPSEFQYAQWTMIALAGAWVLRVWLKPGYRFFLPPMAWAILPFLAYAGWRWQTADVEYIARQEFLEIAFFSLLFLVVLNNHYPQKAQRIIIYSLIGVATLLSLYACYQWLSGTHKVLTFDQHQTYWGRGGATYINPNHFAGFVEMVLPVALSLTIAGRAGAVPRIFLGYSVAVMFAGVVATQSRGGWLATAGGLAFLFCVLLSRKKYRWVALVVAVLVCVAGAFVYQSIERRVASTYLKGHEKENRFWMWESALKLWKTSPLMGVGPNHFDYRYRGYRAPVDKTQGRPGRAHNDYLNTLVDYGVIGLVLALIPIGVLAWSVIRTWPYLRRSTEDQNGTTSNRAATLLGCASGIVAMLIHSWFDFNLHIPANAIVFVVLIAIAASHQRFAGTRFWSKPRFITRAAMTVVLGAAAVSLSAQQAKRSREILALRAAEYAEEASAAQIAAFELASKIEPANPETSYEIGERLRAIAWMGDPGFQEKTREAMVWFDRAMKLNRWDPLPPLRYGMCLDWLEQYDDALPYYQKALALDPNHYLPRLMLGWHYYQAGDLKLAWEWNEKSLRLNWTTNPQAWTYHAIIDRALKEEAARQAKR